MAESWSRQYRSAIFVHDEEQRRLAEASLKRRPWAYTAIEPSGTFWRAEDYHQKWQLRHQKALLNELRRQYPSEVAFEDSTAAARLNGWLAGDGDPETIAKELPLLGLSETAQAAVWGMVGR